MPALNFAEQFAGPVERGEKRQTIRARRKRPIRAGDPLYLFTGMRTKACRKLREETCRAVESIRIDCTRGTGLSIDLDGRRLTYNEMVALAWADGFTGGHGLTLFLEWFESHYGLPFDGQVIHW